MPQVCEAYLQQALSKYRNPDSTMRDVLSSIQHYRGLLPKMETFVFNDGSNKELLNLDGTVPVRYKGSTYNIPICIWLLDTHPYNPPICYVKPTSDMQIKVSRHVDQSGKIYLPYLHEWKHNSSDLLGLIQVMVIVFGDQPPVYARPRSLEAAPPAVQMPQAVSMGNSQLPYPTAAPQFMPMPVPGMDNHPPVPHPPCTTSAYMPTSTYANANPTTAGYGGYQAPGSSYLPYPTSNQPTYPPFVPTSGVYNSNSAYPSYPPQPPMPPPVPTTTNSNTITEEHIKASLLSAVEDKLRRRLREIYAQSQAEIDVLKRTQDDLTKGKVKLETMISRLEQEQMDLEKNILVLNEKNEAMNELTNKMQKQEQIDVDEAVVTTAPLYKQLLNSFAEENAIEDAIYYLGEALRRQVIDLDIYLKHVRELSRKQFMLRALMQRCREQASLPV
ncbi:hypothetical protein CHUAL_008809 [Chamberlinius hualienensis]